MNQHASTLPWLADVRDRLVRQLRENSFPHALLVTADNGIGKRFFADQLAALLVCQQPDLSAGERCGVCKQCELASAGTHPDIRIYAPENSRMIKIGQIRALGSFAVGSPQVAHRKIAIIDRADQLNINSANALLKTLEEPAEDVVLILLQETGRPVLPTVRSRCQSIAIKTPDVQQASDWLSVKLADMDNKLDIAPEQQSKALVVAGYAPLRALELLTADALASRHQALEAFRRFMKGHLSVSEAAKPFKELGLDHALGLFEGWAADLARLAAGGEAKDQDAREMLGFLSQQNPAWKAHELFDQVREGREAMVYNANPELEIARLLFAWQALMPTKRSSAG